MDGSYAGPGSGPLERPVIASRKATLAAATIYLALALFQMRALWPEPHARLLVPEAQTSQWQRLMKWDQYLTVAMIAYGARSFAGGPGHLIDGPQCWPTARATTLGEHMYANALVGTAPWLLTRDPLLTFHAVVLVAWTTAAMGMYALVATWTRSAAAAFVAGLLFAFHPTRILDTPHPYVHGDQWTPLALFFAHRLFTRRRWSDAFGLAACLVLQTMESIYPLFICLLVGGPYGVFLLRRHRRALPDLLPKIAVVLAIALAAVGAVMGPYLVTREIWGTLGGRPPHVYPLAAFGRGFGSYPGTSLLILAAIGLAGRMFRRGDRTDADPRLAILVGGLLSLWASVSGFEVPGTSWQVPSLWHLIRPVVPGVDGLRGALSLRGGLYLSLAVLAGYGAAALLSVVAAHRVFRGSTLLVLAVLSCAEIFYAPFARWSFGRPVTLVHHVARPTQDVMALYERMPDGPVLDVPYSLEGARVFGMAQHVLAAAYHQRPVAVCYNSFTLPLQQEIAKLAKRVSHDARARDALRALGLRTIVAHESQLRKRRWGDGFGPPLAPDVSEVGAAGSLRVLRLNGDVTAERSFALLVPGDMSSRRPVDRSQASAQLDLAVRNGGRFTYRHPDPIEPTAVRCRWRAASGAIVSEAEVRLLLPLALAAGDGWLGTIDLPLPMLPPDDYDIEIVRARQPDAVIARVPVRLDGGAL